MELVRRADERTAGKSGDFGRNHIRKSTGCIEACAYGSPAQRKFIQGPERSLQKLHILLEAASPARDLLTEGYWSGILKMQEVVGRTMIKIEGAMCPLYLITDADRAEGR